MPTFAWLVIGAGAWVATLCATCALLVAAARADAQTPVARASRIADRPAWPACAAVWMTGSIGSGRASARSSWPLGLGHAGPAGSAAAGGAAARVGNIRALRRTAGLALVAAVLAPTASPAAASSALTADPASIDFGSGDIHAQNQNGPFSSVTLTNRSDDAVSVTSVQVSDDLSFVAVNNGCGSVGSGQSCQVQVAFRPTQLGRVSANLVVEDDSGSTDVPLTGTGITGTISASPSPVTFTAQPYYFGGQSQGVQLNVGSDAGVQTSSATITGPGASAFSLAWGANCFAQFFYPNNGCGFGIGFEPPAPGTYTAELEVSSDGTPNPLVVTLSAVALNGPHLTLRPTRAAFGDVPVGQDATVRVTALNDGDYPTQVGETLAVTGRPDVFFVTDNTCDGMILSAGQSCGLTAHFRPAFAGPFDASLFLITGDGRRPVEVVGLSGAGVAGVAPLRSTTVGLTGRARAGDTLGCDTSPAAAASIGWLRDGRVIAGARAARLRLSDADVGARLVCRATLGAVTVTSAASAPVRPRDLAREPGAFIDRAVCRSVAAPGALRAGGWAVRLATGRPVTAEAPLVIRSRARLAASIDGRPVGSGRRIALAPRGLARFGDGAHRLRISAGAASAGATLALLPCRLALELRGGPGRASTVAVSARAGVRSVHVALSGLRVRVAHRHLGALVFRPAGLPARRIELTGARRRANGITVTLRRGRLDVTGLPPEVGVVRFHLATGVLAGRRGSGRASAILRGEQRPTVARAPASWQR